MWDGAQLTPPSKMLFEEHKKLFLNADGTWKEVTYESTKEMPLMDACIRETLRMVSSPPRERGSADTCCQHAPIQ